MANIPFYIARRYLISQKGSTAVTFITWLAAFAMMTAVACMFIIISVFSGLEDLNRDMIANLHADLTIRAKTGKALPDIQKVEATLKKTAGVESFSKVIEEKVLCTYGDASEIAYLRAVDSAYTQINPINKEVFFGSYPSYKFSNEVIMENMLNNRLKIPVGGTDDFAILYMPKAGTGIISKEEDIFNKKEIYATGVFPGKDQLNNFIIAPLELAQELLQLPKNCAYEIVIKLDKSAAPDQVKDHLTKSLGSRYVLKSKEEENAAFWKMINTEKMMIYLIFALVIFITTFNLAGAIIILQLDKKEQAKSLLSLGLPLNQLRNIYFYTGLLIVLFGIVAGLIIGTVLCLLQLNTGFFKATADLPFPIRITSFNYIIVTCTALLFGLIVSLFFSKVNRQNI